MTLADDSEQVLKFKDALLNLMKRWLEESDLDVYQMAEASVDVINKVCGDNAIDFEPDQEFIDEINESEE